MVMTASLEVWRRVHVEESGNCVVGGEMHISESWCQWGERACGGVMMDGAAVEENNEAHW